MNMYDGMDMNMNGMDMNMNMNGMSINMGGGGMMPMGGMGMNNMNMMNNIGNMNMMNNQGNINIMNMCGNGMMLMGGGGNNCNINANVLNNCFNCGNYFGSNLTKKLNPNSIPQGKMNFFFVTTREVEANIIVDFSCTVKELIILYLKRMDRANLINDPNIQSIFLYNAKKIDINSTKTVFQYFHHFSNARIIDKKEKNLIGA